MLPAIMLYVLDPCGGESGAPTHWKALSPGVETAGFSGTGTVNRQPGAPAVKAQVILCPDRGACRTTRTDTGGKFEFDGLPPGGYHAIMLLDGFELAYTSTFEIKAGWEAVQDLVLTKKTRRARPQPKHLIACQ